MKKKAPISLEAPASSEIVRVCLSFIKQLDQARLRLIQRSDDEALHDFRVAMRSIRSMLRAYPEILPIRKPMMRELKVLASYTNPARDAEVRVTWLRQSENNLPITARKAMPDIIDFAISQKDQAYQQVADHVVKPMQAWAGKIKPVLKDCKSSSVDKSFGDVFADRLGVVTEELDVRLHALQSEADYHAVHEARITGKRVRYLLDPLQTNISGIKPLIKELKKLQDLLGDFHDAQVRLHWLEEAVGVMAGLYAQHRYSSLVASHGRSAKTEMLDPVPTLLALTRLTLRQQKQLFQKVLYEQRAGHYQRLIAKLRVQCVRSRRQY